MDNNNALGIPIDDIREIIGDVMDTLGEDVTINGLTTKGTIVDAKDAITVFRQNLKSIVVLYDIPIERGDLVQFGSDKLGVIYTVPTSDIVSYSADILVYNSIIEVYSDKELYDEDVESPTYGNLLSSGESYDFSQRGYIERLTTREVLTDMGYRIYTSFKFVTDVSFDISYSNTVYYKDKKFRINDIDTTTRGLVTIEIIEVV